jgi:hypothetical protein
VPQQRPTGDERDQEHDRDDRPGLLHAYDEADGREMGRGQQERPIPAQERDLWQQLPVARSAGGTVRHVRRDDAIPRKILNGTGWPAIVVGLPQTEAFLGRPAVPVPVPEV